MTTHCWQSVSEADGDVLTSDLPFGSVLRPDSNTVLVLGITDGLVNLNEAGTKVLPSLRHLAVGHPFVLVAPGLSGGIPHAGTHASLAGSPASRSLEQVVKGANGRVEGGDEFPVAKPPASVDGAASGTLRSRNRDTVGRAGGRNSAQLLLKRGHIFSRSHFGISAQSQSVFRELKSVPRSKPGQKLCDVPVSVRRGAAEDRGKAQKLEDERKGRYRNGGRGMAEEEEKSGGRAEEEADSGVMAGEREEGGFDADGTPGRSVDPRGGRTTHM